MLGYRLFRHAVLMLIDNTSTALRISFFPFFCLGVATYLLIVRLAGALESGAESTAEPVLVLFIFALVIMYPVVFVWVAVGWHRYVLEGIEPRLAWPEWNKDRMLAYAGAFFRTIPLAVLLGLAAIFVFLIPAVLFDDGSVSSNDGTILGFLLGVAISFLSMRLSLVLPAAAVGVFMRVPESWSATKEFHKPILFAALCIGVLTAIPDLLLQTPLAPMVGSFLYFIVAQWFLLMLGISIMTALYGHIVEKRELR
ncbi:MULTISPECIES: hypothetical protein [unclassified Ruegeria]|uniref:hypothetical protein n=1 Tax=unclassified Ruegeria TaxID=2625375 RepID=UPI0014879801|nr:MULTISPECIES: hypothetical protein [unclassified Ruegeria]